MFFSPFGDNKKRCGGIVLWCSHVFFFFFFFFLVFDISTDLSRSTPSVVKFQVVSSCYLQIMWFSDAICVFNLGCPVLGSAGLNQLLQDGRGLAGGNWIVRKSPQGTEKIVPQRTTAARWNQRFTNNALTKKTYLREKLFIEEKCISKQTEIYNTGFFSLSICWDK